MLPNRIIYVGSMGQECFGEGSFLSLCSFTVLSCFNIMKCFFFLFVVVSGQGPHCLTPALSPINRYRLLWRELSTHITWAAHALIKKSYFQHLLPKFINWSFNKKIRSCEFKQLLHMAWAWWASKCLKQIWEESSSGAWHLPSLSPKTTSIACDEYHPL